MCAASHVDVGLQRLVELLAEGAPLQLSLWQLCELVEAHCPQSYCSIQLLDPQGERLRHGAAPRLPEVYSRALDGLEIGPCAATPGKAIHARTQIVTPDIGKDPHWKRWKRHARTHRLASCASTPILGAGAAPLGTLDLYRTCPDPFHEAELALLRSVTSLAALAIHVHRREERLAHSQSQLETLIRHSSDLIWMIAHDGTIQYLSPAVTRLLGYTPQELVGSNYFRLVLPEDLTKVQSAHHSLFESRSLWAPLQYRALRKNGTCCLLETCAIRPQDHPQACVLNSREIPDPQPIPKPMKPRQLSLAQAQQLARMGSWEWDVSQQLFQGSGELFRIFGVKSEGAPQPSPDQASLYFPEDGRSLQSAIRQALRSGIPFDLELRLTPAKGERKLVHVKGKAIRDAQGRIRKLLGTVQDITERKQNEERKQHAQLLDNLNLLAASIAHDFNNILTGIQGNLELVRVHQENVAPVAKSLEGIQEGISRAADLARKMLAFTGHSSGPALPTDLNAQIESGSTEFPCTPMIPITVDLAPRLPRILVDPSQLRQVIQGLLLNAVESIHPAGGQINISTGRESVRKPRSAHQGELRPGNYVVLKVSDTGCGMDSSTLQRIFEPFFTTKFLGRGLGLTAIRGILGSIGAQITVESTPNQGSIFTLYFPAIHEMAAMPKTIQNPDRRPNRCGILLVDDDPILRDTVGELLNLMDYHVIPAVDGLDALEKFTVHQAEIRLVLMDLTMPRMDGWEAFDAMRAQDPDLPIILSSGYSEQEAFRTRQGCIPTQFLPKPYGFSGLQAAIRQALEATPPECIYK